MEESRLLELAKVMRKAIYTISALVSLGVLSPQNTHCDLPDAVDLGSCWASVPHRLPG